MATKVKKLSWVNTPLLGSLAQSDSLPLGVRIWEYASTVIEIPKHAWEYTPTVILSQLYSLSIVQWTPASLLVFHRGLRPA